MKLKNKKIAILIESQYQELEVWFPYYRLREEGADVKFIGTGSAKIYNGKYGYPAEAELEISKVNPKDWDAVVIPGGWAPDFLRRYPKVMEFVKQMHDSGKTVASICHGGWIIASAGIVKGKTVTCFSAIKDDLINAGAKYVDKEVAVDGKLITARKPDDLPAFCREIIQSLEK